MKRLPTTHARLFVAHGASVGPLLAQTVRPLPLPEVTYVDWSEWERAAAASNPARFDVKQGVGPSPR
ncbi:MAG TPA: hypothetical protein VFH49_14880 [Aquabacterium sp.]|nr:hypothetical protein [Aquabacterium sp.]